MASSFNKLKELNLSRDEVNRIGDALKNEEFRKLLVEYVEELQDPENRKIYEAEIKELERERGNDVIFLHPTPCYVIKTSINGSQKGFINICVNEHVNKPTSSPTVQDGARGLQWLLPHSLAPPREDIDNKKMRCQVFDVIFHPDTLHLASKNNAFRDIVTTTALEAVENNFTLVLDKKNLKFPKLSYKGVPKPCVIRRPSGEPPLDRTPEEKAMYDKIFAQAETAANNNYKSSPKKVKKTRRNSSEDNSIYTTPKYTIKHRCHVDIQEFTEHKNAKMNTAIPKELVVEIELPLLKSSSDMNLDVTEKTVQVLSEKPAKYKLSLTLPYQVNEASGSAKFDKDLKKLVIVLPVKRKHVSEYNREDSGVDSSEGEHNNDVNDDDKHIVSEVDSGKQSEVSLECLDRGLDSPVHFRTKFEEEFLDASLHYSLPEFTCNVFEDIVAFTLHVKNVDENTLVKQVNNDISVIWLKFISISSSFYPSHCAFCIKFPFHKFDECKVNIEVWDNNVILQIPLILSDIPFTKYYFGINEMTLVEKYVEEPAVLNKVLSEAVNIPDDDSRENETSARQKENVANAEQHEVVISENVQEQYDIQNVDEQHDVQIVHKQSDVQSVYEQHDVQNVHDHHNVISENVQKHCDNSSVLSEKHHSKAIDILATSYESSGDEMSYGSFSPRKNSRGILKRMSSSRSSIGIGRSVSESSLDDFVSSSFENCPMSLDSDIPEDGEMSTSLKKTVRFNDVVVRQLFRSNSSILGQKKKNQRKARNKKRAHDRRHSESEASDVETKKEGDLETGDTHLDIMECSRMGKLMRDKKDDHDIFHLEINN